MKKFLSMVLALAMAMSLVTFAAPAAGAKGFTDDSSIQYQQAVDVISTVKIMEGRGDGSFAPTEGLSRQAAAKIICNMILGPTQAKALPTKVNPYPDVEADTEFAGYIAYCADHDIISGYADGNFRPKDPLSGYAFLKMLLCALGYDQKIEGYQGANWRVNVAKQALGIGLDAGLQENTGIKAEDGGSKGVTRQEAALYAFNTLQSDMVEYGEKTTVTVNGATITTGNNVYHTKTAATQSTAFGNIDDGAMNGRALVQFGEEYFNRLVRRPTKNNDFQGGQDLFGRPSVTWIWQGVEIGTYKVDPAITYYDDVAVNTIYNDLKLAGTSEDAVVYLNGERLFETDIARSVGDKIHDLTVRDIRQNVVATSNNRAPYKFTVNGWTAADSVATGLADSLADYDNKVGKGTIIEVFHEQDTNRMVICAISTYPGQVDATYGASKSKDAYAVISYLKGRDGVGGAGTDATEVSVNYSRNGHNEFETTELKEDDIVWFTYSNANEEIGEAHVMERVTEQKLDRRTADGVQLDGNFYDYAKEHRMNVTKNDSGLAHGSSYDAYLDANGNLLWLEESEFEADRYALIERIYVENKAANGMHESVLNAAGASVYSFSAIWSNNRVRLLLANGTERNIDLDEASRYRRSDDTNVANDYQAGQIVRYVINEDGTCRLYTVSGNGVDTVNSVGNATQFSIINHEMNGIFKAGHANDPEYVVRGDSDTIYVVKDFANDTIRTYKGVRNSPRVAADATGVGFAYVTGNGNHPTARLVFVVQGTISNVSKNITFLAGKSNKGQFRSDEGKPYFEYNAVINGVIQDNPVYIYSDVNGTGVMYGPKMSAPNDGDAPNVWIGNSNWTGSIILNDVTYDTSDYVTQASYSSTNGIRSMKAQGIKRTNRTDEVRLDTFSSNDFILPLANSANVYYVDGDGVISQITVNDIVNDGDDMIYYTLDDGDITNLFICDYEEHDALFVDASITNNGTPTTNVLNLTWNTGADVNAKTDWRFEANSSKMEGLRDNLNQLPNIQSVSVVYNNDNTGTITVTATNGVVFSRTINVDNVNDITWYNVTNP